MQKHEAKYINTKQHFAIGMKWNMVVKRKEFGCVEMFEDGFTCSCKSKKRCNHIRGVEQLLSNGDSYLARAVL